MPQNNPEVSPVIDTTASTPSYTRASRGYESSKNATAGALKDASDIFSMAVKATDDYYKVTSKNETEEAVNAARDEAIVQRTAARNLADDDVPASLKQSAKELQKIDTAKQQGKLRESHYWAKMDLIARDMRAKYPGYREHIDNTVSSLLGTTPANALVKTLAAEQEALAKKTDNDETKWRRDFFKTDGKYVPEEAIRAEGTPQQWPTNELLAVSSARKRRELDVTESKSRLAFAKDSNEASVDNLKTVHNLAVHDKYATTMETFLPTINKIASDAELDKAANSGINSPEFIKNATEKMLVAKQKFQAEISAITADKTFALLPADEQRKTVDSYSKMFDSIIESAQAGTLGTTSTHIKATIENAQARAVDIEGIANDTALSKLLGSDVAAKYYAGTSDTTRLTNAQKLTRQRALTDLGTGKVPPNQVSAVLKRAGVPDKEIADVIRKPRELLKNKTLDDTTWKGIFQNYYGRDGSNAEQILNQGKNIQDTRQIFNEWSSPTMYLAIKDRSNNDPVVLNNYTSWVRNSSQIVFNRELADIRQTTTQGSLVNVNWENGKFVAKPVPQEGTSDDLQALANRENAQMRTAVANLWNTSRLGGVNQVIENLTPLWKDLGLDPKKEAMTLVGITLERVDTAGPDSSLRAFRGLVEKPRNTISPQRVAGSIHTEGLRGMIEDDNLSNVLIDEDVKAFRRISKLLLDSGYVPGERVSSNLQTMEDAGRLSGFSGAFYTTTDEEGVEQRVIPEGVDPNAAVGNPESNDYLLTGLNPMLIEPAKEVKRTKKK